MRKQGRSDGNIKCEAIYTYDNNGNMLTGDNFTNTWDYRNRLTQTELKS
jgi:hypothetical protein